MSKKSGILTCILASTIMLNVANAQEKEGFSASQIFGHSHWTWYALYNNSTPNIVQQSGITDVKPTSTGLEAGFKYTYNLGEHFAIESGMGIGSQNYFFKGGNYDPGFINSDFALAYLQIPLVVMAKIQANSHLYFFGGTGMVIKAFDLIEGVSSSSYGDGATHEVNGSTVDYHSLSDNGIYILSDFEIGGLYLLSKNNMIRINLDFQVGPQATTLANYTLVDANQKPVGTGSYYAGTGYVGIVVGYVFTNIKK